MTSRWMALALLVPAAVFAQPGPSRDEVAAGMRRAAAFYVEQVSTEGGYHFFYTDDLSYGRSEQAEGPTQIELQREGTPLVGDGVSRRVRRDRRPLSTSTPRAEPVSARSWTASCAAAAGTTSSSSIPAKRPQYPYRAPDDCCGRTARQAPTTLDDNVTQAAVRVLMRVDRALDFKDASIHEAALFALDNADQGAVSERRVAAAVRAVSRSREVSR